MVSHVEYSQELLIQFLLASGVPEDIEIITLKIILRHRPGRVAMNRY